MKGERSYEPLTLNQLGAVMEAASQFSFRHRLLANIIPFTGLFQSEFLHLNRDWLVYRYDDSDGLSMGSGSPDSVVVHIPSESPCVGSYKFSQSGRRMGLVERTDPCLMCQPDEVWEPAHSGRAERRILVNNTSAVDSLYWWFERYETLPFSPSKTLYNWLDEIAEEAGVRQFGFHSLRRTFGVVLLNRGADRETLENRMGIRGTPRALEPIYEAAGEPTPWEEIPSSVSDEELLRELRWITEKLNRPPTQDEVDDLSEFSMSTYIARFGGLARALEETGIDSLRDPDGRIRDEHLLAELRRLTVEIGHQPGVAEINEEGMFSYATYVNRFGGIRAARQAAGIEESSEE